MLEPHLLWDSISKDEFLSFAMETAPENDPLCLHKNSLAFLTKSSSLSVADGGQDWHRTTNGKKILTTFLSNYMYITHFYLLFYLLIIPFCRHQHNITVSQSDNKSVTWSVAWSDSQSVDKSATYLVSRSVSQ